MKTRVGLSLAALLAVAVPVSGCAFKGISSVPLPGGVDTGSGAYDVKVEFGNVLDLVQQSQCRVNDVPVGRVQKIELSGWHAVVTCRLRKNVNLPDNAIARISQTSLLGEKFVDLAAPKGVQPVGKLAQGDRIPLSRTNRSTEVEEVLSAMGMLVSGGGLEQVGTINHELYGAIRGREDKVKNVLHEVNKLVTTLDGQKNQIVQTIDRVDKLADTLRRNRKTITDAIDTTEPAVRVLVAQRADLTKVLVSLSKLGTVATRTLNRSRDDTLSILKSLQPILRNLNSLGNTLPRTMEMLITFPFPPTTVNAIRGDYGNLFATIDLDVASLSHNLLAGTPLEGLGNVADKLRGLLSPPSLGLPSMPLGVLPQGSGSPATPQKSPPGQQKGGGLPFLSKSAPDANGDLSSLLNGGTA